MMIFLAKQLAWRLFGWRPRARHLLLLKPSRSYERTGRAVTLAGKAVLGPAHPLLSRDDDESPVISALDPRTHEAPDIDWKLGPWRLVNAAPYGGYARAYVPTSMIETTRRSSNVRALKSMSDAAKRAYDPPEPPPPPPRRGYYC